MEDAHLELPDFDPERGLGLFGVFDGHGGALVSKVVAERLPAALRAEPGFKDGRYGEALRSALLAVDAYLDSEAGRKEIKELQAACPEGEDPEDADDVPDDVLRELIASGEVEMGEGEEEEEEDFEEDGEEEDGEDQNGEKKEKGGKGKKRKAGLKDADADSDEEEEEEEVDSNAAWSSGEGPDGMGTTAVVALIKRGDKPEVFCANVGDSRVVLVRGRKAVAMSRDHKPTLKVERDRILKAGGFVSPDERVDGNLNLSRALGDFAYKKDTKISAIEQKISPEAEIRRQDIVANDGFLLIGCDGIFEKATNQALVNFMRPHLLRWRKKGASSGALSVMCSEFLDSNIADSPAADQGLGCDNMTLMVVDLRSSDATTRTGVSSTERRKGTASKSFKRVRKGLLKKRRRLLKLTQRHNSLKAAET